MLVPARVRNPDGSPIDVTDVRQATWGELEGRRLAEEAAESLRTHVPGFEDAFLDDTATALGLHETRRVVGDYVLTGADVAGGACFDDAVAAGAWPQEYHASTRVMGPSLALGQAAGTAASLAARDARPVADVPVDELQACLDSQGALIA
ncbi:MAG: FAD-dependent oxidoreductase [Acidimicrobiia bacterium]